MRISDWSSDVCSSDLAFHEIERLVDEAVGDLRARQPFDRALSELGALLPEPVGEVGRQDARAEAFPLGVTFVEAIGRRERRIADVAPAAAMPFAEMTSGIANLPHQARQNGNLRNKHLEFGRAAV